MNKLNLISVFKNSLDYFLAHLKPMLYFSVANFLFLSLGLFFVGSFSSPFFLLWAVLYYVFWSWFFRWLFDRKPYYQPKALVGSVVPSTKIFVITIITLMVFIALPLLPLYVALPMDLSDHYIESMDKYSDFLKRYMEDSEALDLGLSFIFIFLAPFIFYRPFYAWISSIIGRSGSIRFALSKTTKNYWRFFLMGLAMNICFIVVRNFSMFIGSTLSFGNFEVARYTSLLLMFALGSPILVFFNVYIAKTYEFFFLENVGQK